MSLWDVFSSGPSPSDDLANGQELLAAYFSEASEFPQNFPYANAAEYMQHLNQSLDYDFVSQVGEVLRNAYAATSKEAAIDRLKDLAYQSEGKATTVQIIHVTGGAGIDTMNWGAATGDVVSASAGEIFESVQNVGTGVLGTMNMMKFLPVIALAAGAFYMYLKFGNKK